MGIILGSSQKIILLENTVCGGFLKRITQEKDPNLNDKYSFGTVY